MGQILARGEGLIGRIAGIERIRAKLTKHLDIQTVSDDRTLRLNSRDFVQASGDSIGLQSKPAQAATTTGSAYGAQISPRVKATFGAGSLIGVEASPILQGTAGDLSGDVRCFDAIAEDGGAGRTIAGVVAAIRARLNMASTVTGGAWVVHVTTPEAALKWAGLLKLPAIANVFVAPGNTTALSNMGRILVDIGGTVYAIPVLENE
jgi:hypothetical protein